MKKLWGSRFQEELAQDAKEYSYSLEVDRELLRADVQVSKAHALMLGRARLISKSEAQKLARGLDAVLKELQGKDLSELVSEVEDIHTLIQAALEKKIGKTARKLHTGRSRNDLIATSTRVWLREKSILLAGWINVFQSALVSAAEKFHGIAIPGYTHLQRAQTVLLSHHLLAYVEMLERDKGRLSDALKRMDECPLGSGALAGSTLPLDREFVARRLGFSRVSGNSLDAVSDRDFVLEILAAIAVLFVHVSRFSEDLILWNTAEFGFLVLPDSYSTGSSLMPQKKNPDMLELARGRSGQAIGNLVSLLVTMKGLPLAYNRDMQEDKKGLFESVKLAVKTLEVLSNLVRRIEIRETKCFLAVSDSLLYATDLVDYLILKGVAFRDAHEIIGKLVQHSLTVERPLKDLSFKEFLRFSPLFKKDIYEIFHPGKSLLRKQTRASTHPAQVKAGIRSWKKKLAAS